MSEKDDIEISDIEIEGIDMDIDRRKVLGAAAGAGATAGLPGVVAAENEELTEEEVRQALEEAEIIPARANPEARPSKVEPGPEDIPSDAKVFVGKYKNAEVPAGKPFEIQDYDEWLGQNSPTGFDGSGSGDVSTNISDFLYFQEDIGSITVAGYTFNVGIGAGVQITGSGVTSLEATLSIDIYIDGVSFSLVEFGVSRGRDGLCASVPIRYGPIPGLQADICVDVQLTYNDGEVCILIGFSLSICVEKVISYCKGVSTPNFEQCISVPF